MTRADPHSSDAKLVNCSLAGDRTAFGLLVERHRAGVTRLLQAMFANMVGIEDLVQESFLRAYLDLDRLRDANRFGAWVRGIAVNLARMELRAGRLPLVSWESMGQAPNRRQPSPEWLAERRELVRRIRQAIAVLPEAERDAIAQVYLNELSHKEAAEVLNTSVGAIKVRVHRGRRRLRKKMQAEFSMVEKQTEVEMIEVTVHDVLAKLAEGESMPQIDRTKTAIEQAEQWLLRLKPDGHRVILLSEKEGARLLPIWVGPVEAESIVIQLQGFSPARPMTFDLMKEILTVGHMQLQEVAVSRLHEKVFYGTLKVKTNGDGRETEIDCRPSDAINLALRVQAPVSVASEIMDQEGVTSEDGDYSYLEREEGVRWVSLLRT